MTGSTTKPTRDLACPVCSSELTIEQLFASEETRQAFNALAVMSFPVGSRVLSYITMFSPPKSRLTVTRKVKLLQDLLPDLRREAIHRMGRDWPAPLAAWSIAIEQMEASRAAGKLQLPLSNHRYLYAILMSMADKVERSAEASLENERRSRSAPIGVSASSAPVPGDLRAQFAARDRAAAPMPAHIAQQIQQLKKGGNQ